MEIFIMAIFVAAISCTNSIADEQKRITTTKMEYAINEEKPVGVLVGKLSKTSIDSKFIQHACRDLFLTNRNTGEITTKTAFDFESLTTAQKRSGFKFYVLEEKDQNENNNNLNDNNNNDKLNNVIKNISMTVKILDINDHIPKFQKSILHITIDKEAKIGTSRRLINAKDLDEGSNALVTYSILNDRSNRFDLRTIHDNLHLKLKSSLKSLKTLSYTLLNVSACDMHLQKCDYLLVNLTVTHAKINNPKFEQDIYHAEVYENVSIGHVILTVKAALPERIYSSGIEYSMFNEDAFSINPRTGEVYVRRKLDAESRVSYNIVVIAKYRGRSLKKAIAHVSVIVLDCNDNAPNVSVRYLRTREYNVVEGESLDTKVAILSVRDNDKDERNNRFTLKLLDSRGGYFGLRKEAPATYAVYVKKFIDRELTPRFVLRVLASDNGNPSLHTTVKINLKVGDLNDNSPAFDTNDYKVAVNESLKIGSKVTTVRARDADLNENAKITYSILYSSVQNWFSINHDSGVIMIKNKLDRESALYVLLKVSAEDHGRPVLRSTCYVNVTILDANDNDPVFEPSEVTFHITENNKVPYSLGFVKARDLDIIGTSQLKYSIDNSLFSVSPLHGEITVLKSLDREEQNRYEFYVYAQDGGGRQGRVKIILDVRDINDNAPFFKTLHYDITVHQNFPIGETFAYIKASDLDEGDNAVVTYSSNITSNGMFSIDSKTGGLILRRVLTARRKQKTYIEVTIVDSGNLKGKNSVIVVIKVVPPSTTAPTFSKKSYNFTVTENNPVNMDIGQVIAKRPNSGSEAFIDYQIKDGNVNAVFQIDDFGVIKAIRQIDYEFMQSFKLTIVATDRLNTNLKVNITIFITVIDQNDNSPVFEFNDPSITVDEGNAVGYFFYTFQAKDADSGRNGMFRYEIVNSTGPFNIDAKSGRLCTNGTLDYELVTSYELFVSAHDLGVPSLKTTIKMQIAVSDVNDNPPLFEKASYRIDVEESVNAGEKIIQLKALDSDSGLNGQFFFKLDDASETQEEIADAASFSVASDGVITLVKKLDREVKDSYSFKVIVQDKGTPAQKSVTRIMIDVKDSNDEIPKFSSSFYTFELREELPAGTTIGALVITDLDIGENSRVTCSLANHEDKFKISSRYVSFYDQSVCTISSRRIFDREKHDASYNITIIAKDHGTPANVNKVTAKIIVKNVHDHPPKFSQNLPYLACVVHGTPKNHQITKIVATDNDAMPLPLNYSLIAMTEKEKPALALFWISQIDGSVYTKRKFDNQTMNRVYEVTIRIKEFGSYNAMFNYQKLIIFVVPNKKKSIFPQHCMQVCVRESRLPSQGPIVHGYEIRHSLQMSNIRNYAIKDVSSTSSSNAASLPFKILQETGLISLTSQLNHKHRPYYQLNVTAEGVSEKTTYLDSLIVNIYIVPKNLYPPSYPSNPEDFVIHENFKPMNSFTTLKKANDLDYGMEGRVMYSIAETMPVDAPISISPLTHKLVFTDHVDREKIEQFVVKVRMTDLALDLSKRLSNTFTVYISVLDVNDNAPIFKSKNFSYVYEDDAVGTTVMTIQAEDPDKGHTNTHIVYSIVSGNENKMFRLERETGHLITNKSLNIYEYQKYVLVIKASEYRSPNAVENITSLHSTMVLSIDVIDINDNAPIFSRAKYFASVDENMPAGTKVVQVKASDADLMPHNKEFIFELLDSHSLFAIDARIGVITTKKMLDREKESLHKVGIMVKNTAIPLGDDNCIVVINVTDVNDFPPVFSDGNTVELHVMENTPPATLHKFVVHDSDLGSNAEVEYRLASADNITGIFHLDKKTGSLFLLKMLDREECDKYTFKVEAVNTSPPYHKATQDATVIVDDQNDEKPVFSKKKYHVIVSEDEEVNATIEKVTAIDRDIGTNANIIYTILNDSENMSLPLGINADTGEIFLIKQLDYEKQKKHVIRIKANGFGFESYNLTTVVVDVKDVNDNSPLFSKPIYNVSIEKVQTARPVLRVQATDADEDGRQRIKYQFAPANHEFMINKNTGEIYIKNPKLTFGQYRLHVKAKDNAYPQQQAFAQVLISIGDANNNILNFLNSTVVFSLMENPPSNYNLGVVIAKSIGNQPVFYNIVETSNPQYAFAIRHSTGEIYVNNSLAVDYEKYPSFFLGVIAYTRHEDKFHSSYLSVLVNLSDVNDNVPKLIPTDAKFPYTETNIKDFPPTYMHLFHVYDADSIDEGKLDIQIISGNENEVFAINNWRHLLVVKNVDYEEQQQYNLVVRVKDSANPPHYSDSKITIEVEDRNDNPPIFKQTDPFYVNETTLVGSIIAQVTAHDPDVTTTELMYSIESPEPLKSFFEIDRYLGRIVLRKKLDYEKQSVYFVNISAYDGIHYSYHSFRIIVLDSNDNAPQFTEHIYIVKVWPELKKNANIAKVTATDKDSGVYGHVQYQIDPPKDAFTIEQDTGTIFTNKDFNFSSETYSYKLKVIAFDSYGREGSLKSSATLNLIISGKKAITPRFTQNQYHMSISEGASIGSNVDQVTATLPSGLHQKMKYSIERGNTGDVFSIDVHKGLITVNNKVDRETIDHYTLELVAHAHGSNESAKCTALIQILDSNDNSPKFENSSYNYTVLENITVGASLLQVKATDADEPGTENSYIKYEVHSGQNKDWLIIDPNTGWVRTQKKLDREVCDSIQLTIKASDMGGSGKFTVTRLNVTVLDVNDNTPQFSLDIENLNPIEISENEKADTIVFKAEAKDADSGKNGRVSYRILDGTGMSVFHMKEHLTGWVYTKRPLDYEECREYNLTILAYDHGEPSKDASFRFDISVKDVDEYQPVFLERSYEFDIFGDMEEGRVVGEVKASDDDTGPAGIVRYSFSQFVEEFSINKKTGQIVVSNDLRKTTYPSRRNKRSVNGGDISEFPLEVRADNGPNSTRYSIVPVTITVNYSCPNCFKEDPGFRKGIQDSLTRSTLVVVFASISVFVILLVVICLAVYCRRKQTCYHKRKHPPPRFCPSKKGEISPGSSLERELLNSGTSSIDRLPTHFFTEYSGKPGTYTHISSETGLIPGSASGTVRTTSGTDKASTFSFGIYHEQAIPESEMHPFTDNLSDMSLKDLEHDSVFAYATSKTKNTKICASRSTKESSLYSLTSNAQKDNTSLRQKSTLPQSGRQDSHESLKDFMEEGGGEAAGGIDVGNLLYAKLAVVDADEQDAVMDGVQPFNEEGLPSRGGSLSTIIGSDVDIRANYNRNYMDNWGQEFNGINNAMFNNGSGIGGGGGVGGNGTSNSSGRHNNEPTSKCGLLSGTQQNNKSDNNTNTNDNNTHNNNSSRISKLNSLTHSLGGGSLSKDSKNKRSDEMTMGLLNTSSTVFTSRPCSPSFTSVMTPSVFRTASVSSIGCPADRPTGGSYTSNLFDTVMNIGVLQRNGSVGSQLSRITLSDINLSEDEIAL